MFFFCLSSDITKIDKPILLKIIFVTNKQPILSFLVARPQDQRDPDAGRVRGFPLHPPAGPEPGQVSGIPDSDRRSSGYHQQQRSGHRLLPRGRHCPQRDLRDLRPGPAIGRRNEKKSFHSSKKKFHSRKHFYFCFVLDNTKKL